MYGSGVKPSKGFGTRWIDHKIRAMGRVIEKFGLYVKHLNSYAATTKNSTTCKSVERKLKKLVDAKLLLRAVFFTDALPEAQRFSLITPEKNINVIKMLNAVETTKSNYEELFKRIKENSEYILNLPNLKVVIDAVKYQGHKLMNYSREVRYLLDHAAYILEEIISCFEQRYGNLFDG